MYLLFIPNLISCQMVYNFILAQLIETSHGLLFGLYGGRF